MLDPTKEKFTYLKKTQQATDSRENFDSRQNYQRGDIQPNHLQQSLGVDASLLSSLDNSTMRMGGTDFSMMNLADSKSAFAVSDSSRFDLAYRNAASNMPAMDSTSPNYQKDLGLRPNSHSSRLPNSNDNPYMLNRPNTQRTEGELFQMLQKSVGRQQQQQSWPESNIADMSEFPALTSQLNTMTLEPKERSVTEKKYMSEKRTNNRDFSMESNEFPALNAAHMSSRTRNSKDSNTVQSRPASSNNSQLPYSGSVMSEKNHGSRERENIQTVDLDVGKNLSSLSSSESIDTSQDGKEQDKYGLLGLLQVIQRTNKDITTLAVGMDLTSLGLNLNSTESLYSTFASPWSDIPATEEAHYTLPLCYFNQPPVLKMSHLSKFHLETLFYVFYSLPRDILQIAAARELYLREWRYHMEHKLWFKQAVSSDGVVLPPSNSNGGIRYIYLDINNWERRLYTGNTDITEGLLSEEDIRTKFRGTLPTTGGNKTAAT